MAYLTRVMIGVDQLANAVLNGWPDETFSARLYRNRTRSWWWRFWYEFVNALFFWQPDHCFDSWLSEVNRMQSPREER